MDQNQVYLIKSGQNSFVETESEITIGISGGRLGVGTTSPGAYLHVTGDTQIDGDLTVKGNLTTVDATTIQVDDKNVELGVGSTTDAAADGGGITLHGATNKTFNWVDSTDAWTSSENLHLANGKSFVADKLQALDADGLSLFDNNASGITVKAGKVGVHKTSPVYDLDVVGSGNFGSLYVGGNSVLTGTAADLGKWSDGSAGEIYYNGGNVGIATNDPAYTLDVAGGGNFTSLYVDGNSVLTGTAADLSKWSDGSTAGEIYYNGGNVGINTNNPSTTLDVNGSLNVEGSFTVLDQFDFGSNGAVGGVAPAATDDIIKWNGSKWVAGANPGGAGAGGGEVPSALINGLISGQSVQSIAFLDTYDTAPRIATELEIDGEGSIIPYVISGVSTTGYNLIFSQEIPNNNYKIHTVFGGKDVYWETGASNSLAYNDGDINLQRNLTVGGNLTVNGTQTIVNTETVEIEDHNLVIGANTHYTGFANPYPGAGDAYAGILWGTGDAGAASSVGLTYQSNKGFAFEGGNVGIGTTSPDAKLHVAGSQVVDEETTYKQADGTNVGWVGRSSLFVVGGGTNDLGISSVDSIQFAVNTGARAMTIDSAGNVGIGTTSPSAKLDVHGVGYFRIPTGGALISSWSIGASTGENQPVLLLRTNETNNADRIKLNSDGKSYFNGGNVGIGTASPEEKLNVYGNISIKNLNGPILKLKIDHSGSNRWSGVRYSGLDETDPNNIVEKAHADIISYQGTNSQSGDLRFSVSNNGGLFAAMYIDTSGNVGIGTTSPSATLQVDTIKTFDESDPPAVTSVSGGIVVPRVSTTERALISSPTNGEVIYNTDNNRFEFYQNNQWVYYAATTA